MWYEQKYVTVKRNTTYSQSEELVWNQKVVYDDRLKKASNAHQPIKIQSFCG